MVQEQVIRIIVENQGTEGQGTRPIGTAPPRSNVASSAAAGLAGAAAGRAGKVDISIDKQSKKFYQGVARDAQERLKKYPFGPIPQDQLDDFLIDQQIAADFSQRARNAPSTTKTATKGRFGKAVQKGNAFLRGGGIGQLTALAGAIINHPAFIPVVGIIAISKIFIDAFFKDGGPGDRRFRTIIDQQFIKATEREKLRDIRLGRQTIRVSSAPGLRGRAGTFGSNLAEIRRGQYRQVDLSEMEYKGVKP